MSYQVIARKWRPQNFDQLVGQNHVSQTLQNALKNSRLHHALLFTGPRGTGKTSSARILAKNLRCTNLQDAQACNQCNSCLDINLSRSMDVIEIDGASNNGVDAIRELRDTVGYMPSSGQYKVYIIDEVHMLSTSAFNALLKTLEEPPAHVIFIMATTEVQKIPATILSRCQRYDFRSISTRLIADSLKSICEKENVIADDDALWIIARQADGSMRDSQSLLDQVITFANGNLNRKNTVEILGLTDRALLLETLSALVARDTQKIMTVIEKIHLAGYDSVLFARDLLENIRNLLMAKISQQSPKQILELPDSELRYLEGLSQDTTEEDLHLLFDMTLKGAQDIPKSSEAQLVLEMLLLRMSQAPRIQDIEKIFSGATTLSDSKPISEKNPKVVASTQSLSDTKNQMHRHDPIGLNPQDRWLQFVQDIKSKDALFAAKIESLLFLGEKSKILDLSIPTKMSFLKDQIADPENKQKLQNWIEKFFGPGFSFQIVAAKNDEVGTSAKMMVQSKQKEQELDMAKKVAEHPMIKSATSAFKGQIKSIKGPN